MEPKFTKGPWFYHESPINRGAGKGKNVKRSLSAPRFGSATTPIITPNWNEFDGCVWEAWLNVREPDAQLIAAAPELYEALVAVKEYSKEHGFFDADVITQAIQALRKARGEWKEEETKTKKEL